MRSKHVTPNLSFPVAAFTSRRQLKQPFLTLSVQHCSGETFNLICYGSLPGEAIRNMALDEVRDNETKDVCQVQICKITCD